MAPRRIRGVYGRRMLSKLPLPRCALRSGTIRRDVIGALPVEGIGRRVKSRSLASDVSVV